MDYNFVFNSYSFPAVSKRDAYEKLLDASRGILAVGTREDRYAIFCDTPRSLYDYEVAPEYCYRDFLSELGQQQETDLQVFLYELEDKTPALDYVSDNDFQRIADCCFYFPDEAYNGSLDVIAIAWILDAILYSIPTHSRWQSLNVAFSQYQLNGTKTDAVCLLSNVATKQHGVELRQRYEQILFPTIQQSFPQCIFTEVFLDWVESLDKENGARVRRKLSHAALLNFAGGEPLFKSLEGGLIELRFSAFSGGAIRILLARISKDKWAILNGFIKKDDNEGYDRAIPEALNLLKKVQT